MKVLVAYASKHGSTKGIAEFIGEKLCERGLAIDVSSVSQTQNLSIYDAFVVGSALYIGHWMKAAKKFVFDNRDVLSAKPVWLFSSGPTGREQKDAKGRDLIDPKVSGPLDLDKIESGLLHVIDHRVFFGAFDPKDLGFFARQFFKSSAIRDAAPAGDFRNWKEIEVWTLSIADFLEIKVVK